MNGPFASVYAVLIPTVSLRQLDLEIGVLRGNVRVHSHEVTKQERDLLAEAAGSPDVDVCPALPRRLTEVPLRPVWVVGAKDVPKALRGLTVRGEGLEVGDRDLNVDDGLGRKLGRGKAQCMPGF